MMTWTVAVLVCFLSLPNDAPTLCLPSIVPIQFNTQQECEVAKGRFISYFHPIAAERNLHMSFKCAYGDPKDTLYAPQETIYDGHITGRSQRLSSS